MPVKIHFNAERCTWRIENSWETVKGQLAAEVLNDCNQYVKEDTGMLLASSYIHSRLDDGILIWQTPYARRQYWEIRTAYQTVNPNATWRWCEAAKRHHSAQWERQAQMLFKGEL